MDAEFEFTLPVGLRVPDEQQAAGDQAAADEAAKQAQIAEELAKQTAEKTKETPAEKPKEESATPAQINAFDELFGDDNSESSQEQDTVVDEFFEAAQELGFQLPEGVEKWTKPLLVEQTKAQIEASKQQLDLSKYDPEIKLLFDFVHENGGSLLGLPQDPTIKKLNDLANYNAEYFFRLDFGNKIINEGLAEEDDEIENIIEMRIAKIPEHERDSFFEAYQQKKIKEDINPLIMERVQELNKEKQTYRDRLKLISEAEESKIADSMIRTIQQQKNFVGIEFSTKTVETIVSKIKSGEIQKAIAKDRGKYELLGYITEVMGPNATKVYKELLDKGNSSQYYEGVRSQLDLQLNRNTNNGQSNDGTVINDWKQLRSVIGG